MRETPLPEYGVTFTVSRTSAGSTREPSRKFRSAAITRASQCTRRVNSSTCRVPPGELTGCAKWFSTTTCRIISSSRPAHDTTKSSTLPTRSSTSDSVRTATPAGAKHASATPPSASVSSITSHGSNWAYVGDHQPDPGSSESRPTRRQVATGEACDCTVRPPERGQIRPEGFHRSQVPSHNRFPSQCTIRNGVGVANADDRTKACDRLAPIVGSPRPHDCVFVRGARLQLASSGRRRNRA